MELNDEILGEELLFRGIIESNWDFEHNRPSSAIFKDSKGVSVDRSANREEEVCVKFLNSKRKFFTTCSIKTKIVRDNNAVALYKKIPDNIYHSEIHDSAEKVQLTASKAKKLRDGLFKTSY